MMLELIIALILGIFAGCIAGLLPGVHINLISVFLLSILTFFLNFVEPITLAVFIVAMAISDTFISFIPSIFLGAPDEDTALSVLPGHKLLLEGKGYKAIILTLYGSIIGIFLILLLSPFFILFLPSIYPYIKTIMPLILLLASGFLIFHERKNRIIALFVFLLAGFLGIATLNLNIKEPLLPLLTGLFGASSLITSIKKKTKLPLQKISKIKEIKPKTKEITKAGLASLIAAPFCSFLPGLGSSQAAVISSEFTGEMKQERFLILLGIINTLVMGLSFVTLYSIEKSRTGAAVTISKILENFSLNNLLTLLSVILISGIIAFFLTIYIAKIFSKNITKISYNKLSVFILGFLTIIVLIFSSWLGLIVFITSAFTGLTAILSGIRRTHLMGCLLLPTILIYLL